MVLVLPVPCAAFVTPALAANAGVVPLGGRKVLFRDRAAALGSRAIHSTRLQHRALERARC